MVAGQQTEKLVKKLRQVKRDPTAREPIRADLILRFAGDATETRLRSAACIKIHIDENDVIPCNSSC